MAAEPVLMYKERLTIGGLKRRTGRKENEERGIIPALYGEWERRRGEVDGALTGRTFGVEIRSGGFDADTDSFDFIAGAARLEQAAALPKGMEAFAAEAGLYAVFTHTGTLADIRSYLDAIYRDWFPQSQYEPGGYSLEVYDERFMGPFDERSVMEVWVPAAYKRPPHCGSYQNTWTTAAQAVREMIKFTERKELSLVDVMGYTGHAFRINIREDNVDVAGPTAWDWGPELAKGLLNLGFRASYLGEPNYTPPTPELLEQALTLVQRSVDGGVPALAWDLFIPEFGVIFGYDDEKMELHAKDVSREGTLPYHKLGRGEAGELFVLTLTGSFEIDKRAALSGALAMIVEHAGVRYHKHAEPPYQNGLAGYDAWIHAFRQGTVDMFGNAYNAALVCDARAYAVRFLKELPQRWAGDSGEERTVRELAGLAAAHYQAVFDALAQLLPLYPFPQGGHPNERANAERSIVLLEQARDAETRGVETLERMLAALRQTQEA